MMISKRLAKTADLLTKGRTVADIGCDHAYTSIYLLNTKRASKVVAMDVNKGPLLRAKENIERYGLSQEIQVRLSNGMEQLQLHEVDSVLISGMGGALMCNILGADIALLQSMDELVLQPQSEVFLVRRFLHQQGFVIEKEDMVFEEGKYYVMMKGVKGEEKYENDYEYQYGKYFITHPNPVFHQYLDYLQQSKIKLLEQISNQDRQKELQFEVDQIIEMRGVCQ